MLKLIIKSKSRGKLMQKMGLKGLRNIRNPIRLFRSKYDGFGIFFSPFFQISFNKENRKQLQILQIKNIKQLQKSICRTKDGFVQLCNGYMGIGNNKTEIRQQTTTSCERIWCGRNLRQIIHGSRWKNDFYFESIDSELIDFIYCHSWASRTF